MPGCTIAIGIVFQFPVVLSLWWLSFTQSGPRQFDETVAP